jgi:ribosomal protein S12 methylthiotransferase
MSKTTKKICIITLGCPKNVVDSEILMKQFQANNLELVQSSDESDATIINTCGFIQSAKKESLDTIMHAVELKKTGRIQQLVVMGCLAERYAADLKKEIPEVAWCSSKIQPDWRTGFDNATPLCVSENFRRL